MNMVRIAQVLGIALALLLNVAPSTAAAESPSLAIGDPQIDGAWLEVLSDTSMDLSERLQIASTEDSINEWFKFVALEGASHGRGVHDGLELRSEQLRVLVEASHDPVLIEVYRGAVAVLAALEELAPEVDLEPESSVHRVVEEFDLGASLTDPRVPAIVADEWASLVEGLVAGVGAAFLQSSDPELALELATAFAERMQRFPRLLALGALDGSVELRGDWRRHLSKEDVEKLERDTRITEQYVSRLADLADKGALS